MRSLIFIFVSELTVAMLSSRLAFARRVLLVVCLGAVLTETQSKSSPGFNDDDGGGGGDGVVCPRTSSPCAPVDGIDDRGSRGRRGAVVVDLGDFWKRARASFPQWQRRFRARHRLRPEADSTAVTAAAAAYPAVKVRGSANAFWNGPDFPPQTGFWRPGLEISGANDPASMEETMGAEFQERKRLDRLMEDDVELQDGGPTGLPSKQRRRQEGLTRPEFNPTGW